MYELLKATLMQLTIEVLILLNEGNTKKAIDCLLEYEGKFTSLDIGSRLLDIESSILEVARHGIKGGLNEEIKSFVKKRLEDDYEGREIVEKIIQEEGVFEC